MKEPLAETVLLTDYAWADLKSNGGSLKAQDSDW